MRKRRNDDMTAGAVAQALVVTVNSIIQAMPEDAQQRSKEIMRACLWSDVVDDPRARHLLSIVSD